MKKIVTVCGQGLGSSLIVELNVKQVLAEINKVNEFEVVHENLNTFTPENFDIVICGNDIAPSINVNENVTKKIVLQNIMSIEEIKEKLLEAIK